MKNYLRFIQLMLALAIAFLLGILFTPTSSVNTIERQQVNRYVQVTNVTRNSTVTEPLKAMESSNGSNSSNDTVDGVRPIITSQKYIDIDESMPNIDELYERLVVVTAFSQNHYKEALGIIGTAQRQMPGKKIVVYDLGIDNNTRETVKTFCNVELRSFPFKEYPAFVKNLLVYSWKPIIINITLNEFGAIYWGDAAVRFKKSLKELLPLAEHHHGYMALMHSFDPKVKSSIKHQYFFTHPGIFDSLGINRTEYYQDTNASPHPTANRQLFINSTTIQSKLVRPLTECALKLECISPPGAKHGQHRYDASALALLIYKNMKYEWSPENNDNEKFNDVIRMERQNGSKYEPLVCKDM